MKKLVEKTRGLIRGTSSAVLLSLLIHGLLIFGAGAYVVFKYVKVPRPEPFVPPTPIDRPKLKLIKPIVKIKKSVPSGATPRITSKAVQNMPQMQLPAVEGMGMGGLGTGVGGFELMPDLSSMSVFGSPKSMAAGNDFVGTFYSMEYDRMRHETKIGEDEFIKIISQFIKSGWNPMIFAPYYRAPYKLYTTQIFIPVIYSEFGPSNFGVEYGPDFRPIHWVVHYKGKIANKEGGRFRFYGLGDDFLLVRVNGQLVMNACWPSFREQIVKWDRIDGDYRYHLGHSEGAYGHWFELKPDTPVDMEVLIGEIPGGHFCAYLAVEKEGEDYAKNREGAPIYPIFKTAELPEVVKDKIKYTLIDGEVDLDADLIFNAN